MSVKASAMLTGVNQMAAEAGATWQHFLDFLREASIFDTELPQMPGTQARTRCVRAKVVTRRRSLACCGVPDPITRGRVAEVTAAIFLPISFGPGQLLLASTWIAPQRGDVFAGTGPVSSPSSHHFLRAAEAW